MWLALYPKETLNSKNNNGINSLTYFSPRNDEGLAGWTPCIFCFPRFISCFYACFSVDSCAWSLCSFSFVEHFSKHIKFNVAILAISTQQTMFNVGQQGNDAMFNVDSKRQISTLVTPDIVTSSSVNIFQIMHKMLSFSYIKNTFIENNVY